MSVFRHEENNFKANVNLKLFNKRLNKIIKLKFTFKKKQTLAVSGHIIFHFKMNLIFAETFLEKSIYFTNKKDKLFINLLWQCSTTIPVPLAFIVFITKTLSSLFCNVMRMSIRRPIKTFFLAASKFIGNSKRLNECPF